jgi:hypothetical protein
LVLFVLSSSEDVVVFGVEMKLEDLKLAESGRNTRQQVVVYVQKTERLAWKFVEGSYICY